MPKRGRDWHGEHYEKVPEVTWTKHPNNPGKIFFYDNRRGKDHTTAVAYSLSMNNGYCNLYWPGGQLIKAGIHGILACQKLIRDRLP